MSEGRDSTSGQDRPEFIMARTVRLNNEGLFVNTKADGRPVTMLVDNNNFEDRLPSVFTKICYRTNGDCFIISCNCHW